MLCRLTGTTIINNTTTIIITTSSSTSTNIGNTGTVPMVSWSCNTLFNHTILSSCAIPEYTHIQYNTLPFSYYPLPIAGQLCMKLFKKYMTWNDSAYDVTYIS